MLYIPGTPIFEGQPPKPRAELPTENRRGHNWGFQTPRKVCVTEEEDGMWILEGDRVRGPKNRWQLIFTKQQQQQQQQQQKQQQQQQQRQRQRQRQRQQQQQQQQVEMG